MRRNVAPDDLFCYHCGRPVLVGTGRMQHRYICSTCYSNALETYGTCAACGVHRLTPGLANDGGRLCCDCAEDIGDFTCHRCGREGKRYLAGICGHCVLADMLAPILDDGTGTIRAELVPLFDALCQMPRPRSGITWLRRPYVAAMLRALATGTVPLTHEGLSQLTPWRSVAYLRDLLIEAEVLPPADRHLMLLERWLDEWLAGTDDLEHRRLLERFATWYVLHRLRKQAEQGPVGQGRCTSARYRLTQCAGFLTFLTERGHGIEQCRQADVDAWFADGPVGRRLTAAFLHWCIQQKAMPRLKIPNIVTANPVPISQHRRLTLIRHLIDDEQIALVDRVLGMLILLYAQPASRVRWLTVDDVVDDDEMTIRLGDPASPVPEPFANLVRRFLNQRPNLMTATNPNSTLLFPGRRAGQPMGSEAIRTRLANAGIPILTGRTRSPAATRPADPGTGRRPHARLHLGAR